MMDLGHLVDVNGVCPNSDKITAAASFETITTVTQLHSFLGQCSYFRRFMHHFADVAYHFNSLLHKKKQQRNSSSFY